MVRILSRAFDPGGVVLVGAELGFGFGERGHAGIFDADGYGVGVGPA
jgi:hypothetical protein